MEIRIRETGQVMFDNEWRRYMKEKTDLNFGELDEATLDQFGSDIVFEGPQATGGTVYQYSMRQGVEQQSDGKWYTKYVLGPIFVDTPEETAAQQEAAYKAVKDAEQAKTVRQTRDEKLKSTDWVVIKHLERNENIPGVWEVYRQALRDVPTQIGFPWNVQWPVQPE